MKLLILNKPWKLYLSGWLYASAPWWPLVPMERLTFFLISSMTAETDCIWLIVTMAWTGPPWMVASHTCSLSWGKINWCVIRVSARHPTAPFIWSGLPVGPTGLSVMPLPAIWFIGASSEPSPSWCTNRLPTIAGRPNFSIMNRRRHIIYSGQLPFPTVIKK